MEPRNAPIARAPLRDATDSLERDQHELARLYIAVESQRLQGERWKATLAAGAIAGIGVVGAATGLLPTEDVLVALAGAAGIGVVCRSAFAHVLAEMQEASRSAGDGLRWAREHTHQTARAMRLLVAGSLSLSAMAVVGALVSPSLVKSGALLLAGAMSAWVAWHAGRKELPHKDRQRRLLLPGI